MATQERVQCVSRLADADRSGNQFYLVKEDTTANQITLSGAGEIVLGILDNKPAAAGRAAAVQVAGDGKVIAGAAFAAGAKLMSDASGKAITYTTGNHCFGVAKAAAGGANEIVECTLMPIGID